MPYIQLLIQRYPTFYHALSRYFTFYQRKHTPSFFKKKFRSAKSKVHLKTSFMLREKDK